MSTRRHVLLLALIGVLSTGCTFDSVPAPTSSEPRDPTSTLDNRSGPGACVAQEAEGLVRKFLTHYNEGRGEGAPLSELYFAPLDRFQWFSDPPHRQGDVSGDLSSLDSYFAERFDSGDQLTLTDFQFNGYREIDDTGHFEMSLLRGEDTRIHGKGAIDCGSSKIMAWATGSSDV